MKNKSGERILNHKYPLVKQSLRIMKITTFLLFFCLLNIVAKETFAQEAKISINQTTTTLEKVLNEIEAKTQYLFVYNGKIDTQRKVSVNVKEKPVSQVLKQILGHTANYVLDGKHIIINAKIQPNSTLQQEDGFLLKGKITASDGEPIIGANVIIAGSSEGTISDFDGNFTLRVKIGTVLTVSYIGFQAKEVKVTSREALNIRLKEDNKVLEEVVVVGYGIQKKENLSGAVTQVDSKAIKDRPITNLTTGLQGLMPGVTITSGQGRPGQDGGSIRVRGVGTLNSANPYILIDGVEAGDMNSLDPNDIESVSVLKDASSAAIYGSKASNGVILITTKRGKSGKAKVNYNGYIGFQSAVGLVDRLSSGDYAMLYNRALEAENKAPRFTEDEIQKFRDGSDPYNYPNTDWRGLAYQTGVQHQHNVSIRGGAEQVSYMVSAGYLNQTGILRNSDREQFNLRSNLDLKINNRLSAHINMAFINNEYQDANASYAGGSSDQLIRQINIIAPWIPYKNEDGTYGTIGDGNPIAWLDINETVKQKKRNFTGSVAVDYQIMDGLKATVKGAYVARNEHYKSFTKDIQYNSSKYHGPNELIENLYERNLANLDVLLNYDKKIGRHSVKALAGYHMEKYDYIYNRLSRKEFPNNDLTDINAGASSTQKNEGFTRELAMLSYFGRINYDFAGKYLFEANVRADASSRFNKEQRWGYFPSFSGAWRVSEEPFMNSTKGWLNNLKIRASWGLLGNQDALNDFLPGMNTYGLGENYPLGGSLQSGYAQKNYKLKTITWEKARTYGIGVDMTLFNALNITVDYYDRLTSDIIMDVPVPNEFALGAYKGNVGEMLNRGVELSVNYAKRWKDWHFEVAGNLAFNHNEIKNLGGVNQIYPESGYHQIKQVGSALNSYYVYKADGLFQSDAEAQAYMTKYGLDKDDSAIKQSFKAGDLRYVDTNSDGKINADDRIIVNSTDPKYVFGFNFKTGYKNFDFSATFTGAAKVARLFDTNDWGYFSGDASHPVSKWLEAWTPQNTNTDVPRVALDFNSPSNQRNVTSTYWIQDASYLRLKNIQLGYSLPKTALKWLGISRCRFFYSAENLFTIDNLPIKKDPEAPSGRGSDYPLTQTHAFGVNLAF